MSGEGAGAGGGISPRIAVGAIDPAAMAGWDPTLPIVELGGATMGTGWRAMFAAPPAVDRGQLRGAIVALLDQLVAEMSHWEPGSALGRFNRAAPGSWTALPPDFATVIAAALDLAAQTFGAFDPAIGALVDLWGFGPVPAAGRPDDASVRAALEQGGWQRLRFDPAARRLLQPGGLRLDLSGIAKGYAVDRASALLIERGVRHSLVEIGGEFVGRGMRPDGDPWWVELETPAGEVRPIRVALHQLAVATSGDYVRGKHTIDPHTGRPVHHALAVSVIHRSAMLADAWATALSVVGPEDFLPLAEKHGLAARALIRTDGGVRELLSPALQAMIAD
jgi:thiamine biosynthesis lipoprotein